MSEKGSSSNFFRPQTLTTGRFAQLMIIYKIFIERPELWLIEFCLIKSVTALLRYFVSAQSTLLLYSTYSAIVRYDWVLTKPCLCSKLSLFKIFWQMLKVLQQLSCLDPSLPYLRAFQWGMVWSNTLRGFKILPGKV